MKTLLLSLALVFFATTSSAQVLDDTAVNLSFSGRLNHAKATTMDSAAAVFIGQANGNLVHINGSTTITGFGTAAQAGIMRHLIFDGVLTITPGSSLLVPGNTTIVTAAGDSALVVADSTTKWIVLQYTRRATAP